MQVRILPRTLAGRWNTPHPWRSRKSTGIRSRGAERVDVDLWLPRFRRDNGFDPVSQLEGLGLTDLSRPGTADLTVMTTTERLSVSRVLHKAFVIVDEWGGRRRPR